MKVPEIIHKFIIAKKMGLKGSEWVQDVQGKAVKGEIKREVRGQLPTAGSGALQIRAITE